VVAIEALTAVLTDVSGQLVALIGSQNRLADSVAELVGQGASATPPPPAAPTDMSGVVSALKRVGDSVAQAVKAAAAARTAPEAAAPEAAPEAEPADDEAAADEAPTDEAPADESPADEALADADADADAEGDEAEAEAAPEAEAAAEPEPEPEPAPLRGTRVAVGHSAAGRSASANVPPSIHKTATARQAPPVVRAPDTSERGYAVTIKPAIAVVLGKYLPKALQVVSDTLGSVGKPKE
jgi:hypothetical protein